MGVLFSTCKHREMGFVSVYFVFAAVSRQQNRFGAAERRKKERRGLGLNLDRCGCVHVHTIHTYRCTFVYVHT